MCQLKAYHTRFSAHIIEDHHPICHLEVVNVVVAVWHWAPQYRGQLIHLFSDSATAVAMFKARKGRDAFIQGCAQELWLSCAELYITLGASHMPEDLTLKADALSSC